MSYEVTHTQSILICFQLPGWGEDSSMEHQRSFWGTALCGVRHHSAIQRPLSLVRRFDKKNEHCSGKMGFNWCLQSVINDKQMQSSQANQGRLSAFIVFLFKGSLFLTKIQFTGSFSRRRLQFMPPVHYKPFSRSCYLALFKFLPW